MKLNVKKGVTAIVIGVVLVVVGASLVSSDSNGTMIIGWIFDIVGVALGLYGFGYLTGLLHSKK